MASTSDSDESSDDLLPVERKALNTNIGKIDKTKSEKKSKGRKTSSDSYDEEVQRKKMKFKKRAKRGKVSSESDDQEGVRPKKPKNKKQKLGKKGTLKQKRVSSESETEVEELQMKKSELKQKNKTRASKKEFSGEEKLKPYLCNIKGCTRSYVSLQSLSRHKKDHKEALPHSCQYCAKSYKRSDHCSRHLLPSLDITSAHDLVCLIEQMRTIPGNRDKVIRKICNEFYNEVIDIVDEDQSETEEPITFPNAKADHVGPLGN